MSAELLYRAGTVKRQRRTAAAIRQLDRQIIDVLRDDHPQSVRHLFYRMTEPVEKSDRGYRHVQERCVKLRRSGAVPYGWIADMSRRGYFVATFDGAGDFVDRMSGLYRADVWRDAHYRCEVGRVTQHRIGPAGRLRAPGREPVPVRRLQQPELRA